MEVLGGGEAYSKIRESNRHEKDVGIRGPIAIQVSSCPPPLAVLPQLSRIIIGHELFVYSPDPERNIGCIPHSIF